MFVLSNGLRPSTIYLLLRRGQGRGLSDSFAIGRTVQMIPMDDMGRRLEDWNNRVGLIRYLDWLSRKST